MSWWHWLLLLLGLAFAAFVLWLRSLARAVKRQPVASVAAVAPVMPFPSMEDGTRYTVRGGKSVRAGAVFDAWTGGSLHTMLAVLHEPAHAVDRHFLLCGIVAEAYKLRTDTAMADLCASVAETFLAEFKKSAKVLKHEWPSGLPHITVFQHYATLLTERHEFDRAIEVCETAISYGLHDGTQGSYEGRIARITKARFKAKKG